MDLSVHGIVADHGAPERMTLSDESLHQGRKLSLRRRVGHTRRKHTEPEDGQNRPTYVSDRSLDSQIAPAQLSPTAWTRECRANGRW
jgi:hypothetical protein